MFNLAEVERREEEMTMRFESIDELKRCAGPEFVAKNAAQLGIVATVEQVYANQATPKQNKYHVAAREDRTYKGVIYDSKREMMYYRDTLEPQLLSGELDYVLPHVCFPLGGGVKYECDFMTLNKHDGLGMWWVVVYEVKMWRKATAKHPAGFWFTPDAKIKMKLFREQYKELKLEIVK
jgi:hypothetical protein